MSKRQRRNHTKEFKEEAVKLISEQGYAICEAARNLGVNPALLGRWKREMDMNRSASPGSVSMMNMQAELIHLRKENKRLKLEREILKKAATFFAKETD
ncbi:MAG: transposase [Nitrospiria bacterium]